MEKIRKYFGGFDMTWPRVLIFAVITAVVTAVLNELKFLDDTSFQDIAVYLECWILFAVFIIVNCKTWWEAALKCFVFFLVSQPLIYLIEVPFEDLGWGIFTYYRWWGIMTVLTLPGAAIAFLIKKKNWLSVIVLSVATAYLAYQSVYYFKVAFGNFPRHILSAVFCLALIVFFVFVLLDEKKFRAAALTIAAVAFAAAVALTAVNARPGTAVIELGGGTWGFEVDDPKVVSVEMIDADTASVTAGKKGNAVITFESTDGEALSAYVTVSGGDLWVEVFDD